MHKYFEFSLITCKVVLLTDSENLTPLKNIIVSCIFKVVGLARRSQLVEKLSTKLVGKKGKLYAIKADISQEEDILAAFNWVKENLGPIHILINNAGVLQDTNLIDGETNKWKIIFDTNVLGLCMATREAVKIMRAHNIDGQIIHINSVAGHGVPNFPGINVYPASKHAVTALTESLRQELNRIGSNIKITVNNYFMGELLRFPKF